MNHEYRLPAEWEPQSMVQLTWPHSGTDWADMLDEINEVYVQMAREIARREQLLIVTPFPNNVKKLLGDLDNVFYFTCPTDDTWARDHGFITLVKTGNEGRETGNVDMLKDKVLKDDWLATINNGKHACKLLDFRFNGWGKKFSADYDNCINIKLWALTDLLVKADFESHDDFVLEGGSIESDGRGTVFTTSQCLLAPNRNQPMTQEEIEQRLKKSLCADRIVWLDHGNLIGDDTDGHIDTIVRCVPEDTLLYMGCDNTDDEQYEDFLLLERQLQQLRTAEGKPYRLMRLPMPEPIFEKREEEDEERQEHSDAGNVVHGDRLPATYANFLVINDAVLVPTYGQPSNDAEAMRIIGEAFPGREIIGIDSRPIIRQHGSVHCCAMQYPNELC